MTACQITKEAYALAPNETGSSFERYFEHGILPGGFLQAVLANHLYLAAARADYINIHLLREYYYWLLEYAPAHAWGSPKKMMAFLATFPDNEGMAQRIEV